MVRLFKAVGRWVTLVAGVALVALAIRWVPQGVQALSPQVVAVAPTPRTIVVATPTPKEVVRVVTVPVTVPTATPTVEVARAIPITPGTPSTAVVGTTASGLVPVATSSVASPPPADPAAWLAERFFTAPTCNPFTYLGWGEVDFEPTGASKDSYDFVLEEDQTAVLWGTGVTVNGTNYGRSLVVLVGPSRSAVTINDGAYWVGLDSWGFFPLYWQKVLRCLYEGTWPVVYANQVG